MGFIKYLLELIIPPNCVICGEYSEKEELCESCKVKLEGQLAESGIKLLNDERSDVPVPQIAPYIYRAEIKKLIIYLKDNQDKRSRGFLAKAMLCCTYENFPDLKADFVAYTPMRAEREQNIGFNHAKTLAQDYAMEAGLPVLLGVLAIKDEAKRQHFLKKDMRVSNAHDNIYASGDYRLDGKVIIIVDDICTTGATILACAQALYSCGAEKVIAVTAARAEFT